MVHLDNLACQTGASRFTQLVDGWTYDKTEGLSLHARLSDPSYTHIITEPPSEGGDSTSDVAELLQDFEVVATVTQTSGVLLDWTSFPPVKFRARPALMVLERRRKQS